METGTTLPSPRTAEPRRTRRRFRKPVIDAAIAVAALIDEKTPHDKYEVHRGGVQELVADKSYHSSDVLRGVAEMEVRTYIAEPDRGTRNWEAKAAEKAAVYGNRRRIQEDRGKGLQRRRGERIERNFAHQFDTGGLDRLYVRGKKMCARSLIQAAACNLALLMRSTYGAGKPRAAHDATVDAIEDLAVMMAFEAIFPSRFADSGNAVGKLVHQSSVGSHLPSVRKRRFRQGLPELR